MAYNPNTATAIGSYVITAPPVGGGGFCLRPKFSNDGTLITSADTVPALFRKPGDTKWTSMLRQGVSIPADSITYEAKGGTYDSAIHATNSNHMATFHKGYLWKSTDGGATFTKTSFPFTDIDGNATDRTDPGARLAYDPADTTGATMLMAVPNDGLYYTTDSWATRTKVTGIPAPVGTTTGGLYIVRDPTAATTGSKTQKWAVSSVGNGIYLLTASYGTVTQISSTLKNVCDIKYAADGKLWVCGAASGTKAAAGPISYYTGTWTAVTSSPTVYAIAPHPSTANTVYFTNEGGSLWATTDGTTIGRQDSDPKNRVATDYPWLALTNEAYMSNGGNAVAPATTSSVTAGDVIVTEGIGVWKATNPLPNAGSSNTVTWNSINLGLDNLIGMDPMITPNARAVYGCLDRPAVAFDLATASDFTKTVQAPSAAGVIHAQHAGDYLASDPNFMVMATYRQGNANWVDKEVLITTDGWKTLTTKKAPTGTLGAGNILCFSTSVFVYVPAFNGGFWRTTDGGTTWTAISLGGFDLSGTSIFANYLNRVILAKSRTNAGTAYIYWINGLGKGVWKTTDSGASWTRVFTGNITGDEGTDQYNGKLRVNPLNDSQLFWTPGDEQGPAQINIVGNHLKFSNDGGATWNTVSSISEVHDIAFCKPFPGDTYRLQAHGWVGTQLGLYESRDFNPATCAATWTLITKAPLGSTDPIWGCYGDVWNSYTTLLSNGNQTGALLTYSDVRACA